MSFRMLCVGDSLTSGYHHFGLCHDPYSNHLKKLLQNHLKDLKVEVIEIGSDGYRTDQILEQFDAFLKQCETKKEKWDCIAILGGTNDIGYKIKANIITKNLAALHKAARDHGAKNVALTIPRVNHDKLEKQFESKCEVIRQFLLSSLKCDLVVDIYKEIDPKDKNDNKLWDDLLHFTKKGYEKFAEIIFASMIKTPGFLPGNQDDEKKLEI